MSQFLMVASAIAGTVGTVSSMNQQKRMATAQKRQTELQNRRSQRQALREAQIRRASAIQGAQAAGASQGSGIAGGLSSLGSQFGESAGFSSQMSGLNNQVTSANQKANMFADIGKFGFNAFDYFSNGQGFSALFPKKVTP